MTEPLPTPHLPAPPTGTGQRWRGALLTGFLVGVTWIFCLRTPAVWEIAGLGRDVVPFLDLHGSLAAGELARSGGNPYAINPLDVFGRPHLYSSWWLVTGDLGLTRADAVWLGSGLLAAVLLAALLILRPATNRQIALSVLLLVSPAWLLAVNRANNDLVIFLLIAAALAALRCTAALPRLAAAGLLALAAILKYFPAVIALLLLEARSRREVWGSLLIAATLLALGWASLQPALEAALRFLPQPSGFYTFGAPALARALGVTSPIGWLLPTAVLGFWSVWLAKRRWRSPAIPKPALAETREFIAGAALIAGCFFLGVSYVYKLVFAVWLLPLLWRSTPAPILGSVTWQRATLALLLGVLWWDGAAAGIITLVVGPHWAAGFEPARTLALTISQVFAWGLIVCLVRAMVAYCVDHLRDRVPVAA